jgi:hypothetical protein
LLVRLSLKPVLASAHPLWLFVRTKHRRRWGETGPLFVVNDTGLWRTVVLITKLDGVALCCVAYVS